MNFRDYASVIRTKASAVARNIPNFDDMAANDDYIHSEEFNVRGQPRAMPESLSIATVTAPPAGVADPDETSSMGSWSLLDRPPAHLRSPGVLFSKDKLETFSIQGSLQGGIDSTTMSASTSVSSEGLSATKQRLSRSSSSIPLLSVVANALDDNDTDNADPGDGDGLDTSGESDSSQSDDASVDSELDDDENDPILSIIRQSKTPAKERQRKFNAKRKKSVEKKTDITPARGKSSQRFLQDLDERASDGAGDERIEATPPVPTPSSETTTVFGMKAPFGGLLINVAKSQFDRILRRTESSAGADIYSSKTTAPPLARERPQKAKTHAAHALDFQSAASTSFMGDEEMAELARLKGDTKLGRCSVIVGLIQAYQSYCLIIVTLILAIFVFFFQRSPDDVT